MNLSELQRRHKLIRYSCTLDDRSDCCGGKATRYTFRRSDDHEICELICNKCRETCSELHNDDKPRNYEKIQQEAAELYEHMSDRDGQVVEAAH